MSLARRPRQGATLADLLAIHETNRFHEIIDGELVQKAMPSGRHGGAQAGIVIRLGGPYGRRRGGRHPGGWLFATETEVLLADDQVFRPDVAGWRRERLPELPATVPVTERPDWVCEVLSSTNAGNDLVKKLRAYHRAGVPHYWILDPLAETLFVYRWTEPGYVRVVSAQGAERVCAEPFEAVTFSVSSLIDPSDDDE